MYMYVTFKNITELEMVENKFNVLEDVEKDLQVHNYLRQIVSLHTDISILGLAKEAILKFGDSYPAMSIQEWTKLARKYAEKRTKNYELKDDEPINWMAAESDPEE